MRKSGWGFAAFCEWNTKENARMAAKQGGGWVGAWVAPGQL